MPRSHPPTLIKLVQRTLVEECEPLRSRTLLAAVSGGGDSQAMLWVLAHLAPRLGFRLLAHGVDHGLRPEASAELDLAEELARKLRVPFARTRLALEPSGNLQARAAGLELPFAAEVQVRYRGTPLPARVSKSPAGARVVFEKPVQAVVPGQFAVFYAGSRVLGGGLIAKALDVAAQPEAEARP